MEQLNSTCYDGDSAIIVLSDLQVQYAMAYLPQPGRWEPIRMNINQPMYSTFIAF